MGVNAYGNIQEVDASILGGGIYGGSGNLPSSVTVTMESLEDVEFSGTAGITRINSDGIVFELDRTTGADVRLSAANSQGYIGTYTNHDFEIKVNNAVLIDAKTTGQIWFGDPAANYTEIDDATIQVLSTSAGGFLEAQTNVVNIGSSTNDDVEIQRNYITKIDIQSSEVQINDQVDINTTTGALIVPRMTTTQRNALSAVNGMIIYNTTTNQFNFFENSAWVTK